MGLHELWLAAFLPLGIVDQARSAVQSDGYAIRAVVIGILAGLVGNEVSALVGACDAPGTWWNPGKWLNVTL